MTQHEPAPLYSDDERDMLASRALHDAELVQGDAKYNKLGVLAITGDQFDQLHDNEAMRHFAKTDEARLINDHQSLLHEAANEIGIQHLAYAAVYGDEPHRTLKQIQTDLDSEGLFIGMTDIRNGQSAGSAIDAIQEASEHLNYIAYTLANREDLRFGEPVNVMPGETKGNIETDWTIDDFLANGDVIVMSADEELTKQVPFHQFMEANPQAED